MQMRFKVSLVSLVLFKLHGYPSCVRVGRGSDEIDQPSSWAGAVTQKSPVNAEKS